MTNARESNNFFVTTFNKSICFDSVDIQTKTGDERMEGESNLLSVDMVGQTRMIRLLPASYQQNYRERMKSLLMMIVIITCWLSFTKMETNKYEVIVGEHALSFAYESELVPVAYDETRSRGHHQTNQELCFLLVAVAFNNILFCIIKSMGIVASSMKNKCMRAIQFLFADDDSTKGEQYRKKRLNQSNCYSYSRFPTKGSPVHKKSKKKLKSTRRISLSLILLIVSCFFKEIDANCYYRLPPTGPTIYPLDASSKSLDTILTQVPTAANLLNCYAESLVGTIPTKIGDYTALTLL